MSKTKMFIRVGSDEVPLGEIHPAQARILVKKEYAFWDNNRLIIFAQPAFLALAQGDAWVLNSEKFDVSPIELERRKIWFKSFFETAVSAVTRSLDKTPRVVITTPTTSKEIIYEDILNDSPLSPEEKAFYTSSDVVYSEEDSEKLAFLFTYQGEEERLKKAMTQMGQHSRGTPEQPHVIVPYADVIYKIINSQDSTLEEEDKVEFSGVTAKS